MMITDTATGLPQIKAGKLRALGVSTTRRDRRSLPDVPTIAEAGVKGYDMGYWFAAYVPAEDAAAPVVERLHELLVAGREERRRQGRSSRATGTEACTTTPEELAKFQAAESQKWGRVIKAAGIEPE